MLAYLALLPRCASRGILKLKDDRWAASITLPQQVLQLLEAVSGNIALEQGSPSEGGTGDFRAQRNKHNDGYLLTCVADDAKERDKRVERHFWEIARLLLSRTWSKSVQATKWRGVNPLFSGLHTLL